MHGPGQQVQIAPIVGPGSNSHSGLIDPCNLFCKVCIPSTDDELRLIDSIEPRPCYRLK